MGNDFCSQEQFLPQTTTPTENNLVILLLLILIVKRSKFNFILFVFQ